MESQPTPVPCSAALAHQSPSHHPTQHHHQQHHSYNNYNNSQPEYDYSQPEKDQYQRPYSLRLDRQSKASSHGRPHDSVISSHHPFSPKPSSPPSPSSNSSISSLNNKRNSSQAIRYDQSQFDQPSIPYPQQAHLDPEKHADVLSQSRRVPNRISVVPSNPDVIVYDKGAFQEKGPEEKAWQLLFWLFGPCAFLSIAIALWTALALFITLILSPLRLCSTRRPFSEQIISFLAPALNLQLHMVYSHDSTTGYSASMLVVIHLFSPLVAFGVAIAAWTAAGFWFFSCILGDPGGHDGHNDGRESIVGVRNYWERWLSRGLRETNLSEK